MHSRFSRTTVAAAIGLAASLGGLAACRGGSSKIASDATTTTLAPAESTSSSATAGPGPGQGASSTSGKAVPTSSTIAYFTLPPSTTTPGGDGGGGEPGESVGRRFVDAVMDGKRDAAKPLATAEVIKQFEPWKPYSRQNNEGVKVPDYRYSGSTTRGSFNATLAPTVFVHCEVDRGKVVACSFGE